MRDAGGSAEQLGAATQPSRAARLVIPLQFDASDVYRETMGRLIAGAGTHIYIDTSFLMWATKIGPASRGELLEWLRSDLGERAHVPTWSAHEYLRHHVAGTIVDELTQKTNEVSQLAGSAFTYFRPFLDDPALPAAGGWVRLRASTRDAVNTLVRLAEAAKDWKKAYAAHAEEIIEYINERVLASDSLFADLPDIAAQGAARYEGRIPPGYQDRNKKGSGDDDPDEKSVAGANRYGDLIFWKEAVAHAKAAGAQAMVILTNDRKNDWRMGGESKAPIDATMLSLKKAWRPVPKIHPMLALEAELSGIGEVALMDSQYLAAFLRGVDAERVGAFADVAIVPDPPTVPTRDEERAAAVARRRQADAAAGEHAAAAAEARAEEEGYRFLDDPAVGTSLATLAKAMLASRDGPDARGAQILTRVRADVDPVENFSDILNAEELAGMDTASLVALGRAIHDHVVAGEPGYSDALVDLAGLLDELPPGTAGGLFLGMAASMYLETGSGASRIPPASPVMRQLLAMLERPFAANAAKVVGKRVLNNERSPLYAPTEEAVEVRFDVEPETMESDELRSLKIAGVEVLVAAQDEAGLRLCEMLGGDTVSAAELLAIAAELFALPPERLVVQGDEVDEVDAYKLTDTIGFRQPSQVARIKEQQ